MNAPDNRRGTPLHNVAKAGDVGVIQLLLESEADIEARSRTKETALHLAVKNPESVEALVEGGADRASADSFGQIPLHMAACRKFYNSADLLILDAGIDARKEVGRPPLVFAIRNNDIDMVKALYKHRYNLRDSQDRMRFASGVGRRILCARRASFPVRHIVPLNKQARPIWADVDP